MTDHHKYGLNALDLLAFRSRCARFSIRFVYQTATNPLLTKELSTLIWRVPCTQKGRIMTLPKARRFAAKNIEWYMYPPLDPGLSQWLKDQGGDLYVEWRAACRLRAKGYRNTPRLPMRPPQAKPSQPPLIEQYEAWIDGTNKT